MTINLGTITATVDGDHLTGETKVEAQSIELLASLRAQATTRQLEEVLAGANALADALGDLL